MATPSAGAAIIFGDAEKFAKTLKSGNKIASELLKKATALQAKLQMMEQARAYWCLGLSDSRRKVAKSIRKHKR